MKLRVFISVAVISLLGNSRRARRNVKKLNGVAFHQFAISDIRIRRRRQPIAQSYTAYGSSKYGPDFLRQEGLPPEVDWQIRLNETRTKVTGPSSFPQSLKRQDKHGLIRKGNQSAVINKARARAGASTEYR